MPHVRVYHKLVHVDQIRLVEDVNQMAEKIKVIEQISRQNCRKSVEERFTIEKTVDGYEAIYASLI